MAEEGVVATVVAGGDARRRLSVWWVRAALMCLKERAGVRNTGCREFRRWRGFRSAAGISTPTKSESSNASSPAIRRHCPQF